MESIISFLIEWGYLGIFLSAVVAGSVIPLSSEAVLMACIGAGSDPYISIIVATIGNMIGGITCYWLGTLGNMHWIERYLGIDAEKLNRAEKAVKKYGAYMAFFMFAPVIGEAIGVVLGILRTNKWTTFLFMFLGKLARYAVIGATTIGITSFF